jgi:starch synthase
MAKIMKVLFVASECAPFVKTGGLADVIGALPKAITMLALGVSVKVLIPAYPNIKKLLKKGTVVRTFDNFFGGKGRVISVITSTSVNNSDDSSMELLLLDAPHLYNRAGNIYVDAENRDWPDNHLKFAALSFAAAEVAQYGAGQWRPDVVHAHDWQAGLVSVYLKQCGKPSPPVVMTIHNIAFQGLFGAELLPELRIKPEYFSAEGLEFYGMISFLKAGLVYADKITTVSPTYAQELLSPEFGMGFEGLLHSRKLTLQGILNGIDVEVWNPAKDTMIAKQYESADISAKARNREVLQGKFSLRIKTTGLLFCVVSRLTHQKGLDVLLNCLPHLVGCGAQLAVLGSGEKELEQRFIQAAKDYDGDVGVIIGYDEALSHLLQAGSDAILIPSRFEPCGLTQLYGLRYGTVPIVARTGGLADTVIDANDAAISAQCATGIQFAPVNEAALAAAITRACGLYQQQNIWLGMVERGMKHSVDWQASATAYVDIYRSLSESNTFSNSNTLAKLTK